MTNITITHPHLIEEWDDLLTPDNFTYGSNKEVFWKCSKGHRWKARISSRSRGSGCPICDGRKVLAGFNDLATTHPELVEEWEDKLSPTGFSYGSRQPIDWKCNEGHKWNAAIYSRAQGKGCPVCSGREVLVGFNDLATTHPELMEEWNDNLSPIQFSRGSKEMIQWRCRDCKDTWKASILLRTSGSGCPHCSRFRNSKKQSRNSLTVDKTKNLRDRWDYSRNSKNPSFVLVGSEEKYWWRCDLGHSYLRSVKGEYSNHLCSVCKSLENPNIDVTHPELLKDWNDEALPTDFTYGSNAVVNWKCSEGHEWRARVSDRAAQGQGCPTCSKVGPSKKELEFQEFVKTIHKETVLNDRSLIPPKELDVYLPDKNLAFEFNGVYWHSETQGKDKDYHYNKWRDCKDKGVQLIQVWEDDWDTRRPIVEEMVKNKLGVSTLDKISARKTEIKPLEVSEARDFLDQYHIQGFIGARYHYALVFDEEPVAVLSLRSRGENKYELVRYATSAIVQGGFSKLLKYVVRKLGPKKIVTFSDNEVSDGGLYKNTGFKKDGEIAPDYSYLAGRKREHKFGYRKKRFKTDPDLRWEDGLTERELAELNGLERIWDSGKVRWVYE